MMHMEVVAAVESFSSTETLDSISVACFPWSAVRIPDFSVIQMNRKKLLCFQSTMFAEYLPAAELCKDRDKITRWVDRFSLLMSQDH